jgi:hypothetical protein
MPDRSLKPIGFNSAVRTPHRLLKKSLGTTYKICYKERVKNPVPAPFFDLAPNVAYPLSGMLSPQMAMEQIQRGVKER